MRRIREVNRRYLMMCANVRCVDWLCRLSDMLNAQVCLKLENTQHTGGQHFAPLLLPANLTHPAACVPLTTLLLLLVRT